MMVESGTLYRLLRIWVRLGAFFYFRDLRISGLHHVPPSGPVLITANHQNSFLDAIVIAILLRRPMHFLVRSDVFRKPLARRFLHALNMMPVFRIRDGWQNLGNNAESFSRCAEIFRRGGMVLIFPEGNHSLLRRLRPLSRGFTKVIASVQPAISIQVLPVGLNFTSHQQARSAVHVVVGQPLPVSDYVHQGTLQSNRLRDDVSVQMKQLITHVEDVDRYDKIIAQLKNAGTDFFDPVVANRRIRGINTGEVFPRVEKNKPGFAAVAGDAVVRLLHFPVVLGWRWLKRKISDPVFIGSIRFVYVVFAVPLYYLVVLAALAPLMGWPAVGVPVVLAFSTRLVINGRR